MEKRGDINTSTPSESEGCGCCKSARETQPQPVNTKEAADALEDNPRLRIEKGAFDGIEKAGTNKD